MRCSVIHLQKYFPFLGEDGRDPSLEVYLPCNLAEMGRQDQIRPVALILPGGAYCGVSQREGEPVALHLLSEGYCAFVLRYSVAPHRYPAQLTEVAAAVELIRQKARAWSCDPDRIVLMGFSAGGHLAAHYANAYGCPQVRRYFPDSKPVRASALCYPVISADPQYAHGGSFENLMGHFPLPEAEAALVSCEKLVSGQTPPTFLWHTADDEVVPVNNTLMYAQALSRQGVPFEIHIFPSGRHGLSTADTDTNDSLTGDEAAVKRWLTLLKQWLKRYL